MLCISCTETKNDVWVWRRNRSYCSNSLTKKDANRCSCFEGMLRLKRGGAIPLEAVLLRLLRNTK